MARTGRYEIDMCSGKLLPKILTFALPLMCSSVLQLLFNAADIVVVGKFAGDNSLAAVGSNAALINLMVNLFVGLSVGANILAARYTGAETGRACARRCTPPCCWPSSAAFCWRWWALSPPGHCCT